MAESGGDLAAGAKRARPSSDSSGEDRLSALPDDVLVLILLRLCTPAAARTSALARRWRRVWALLPELRFLAPPEPRLLRGALDAHEAPLRALFVGGRGASAESLATWAPAAARRVSGDLAVSSRPPGANAGCVDDEAAAAAFAAAAQRGVFELPRFERATSISLDLRHLGLAVPPAGVFSRLTSLDLSGVRFHGACELGEAVSSPRCSAARIEA
ncbi:hypothetical protein ACP4OV_011857 [Aristida adscensionis]